MKTIDGTYLSGIRESEISQAYFPERCNSQQQQLDGAERSFWQLFDHKTYGSKLGGKTTRKRKKEEGEEVCRVHQNVVETFNELEFIKKNFFLKQ